MGDFYCDDLADVLAAAGCRVAENATTAGWERRARGSGGFPGPPLGVQWHHTASQTSPASDLSWMIDGSADAPVGNVLLDRTGCFWPVAAGGSNTAGKGGPVVMSRGVVGMDSANSTTFAVEAANNGTGEPWPAAQVDALFAGTLALNAHWDNEPDDVFTHAIGVGDGWTDRKIDPATATAVEGPWHPGAVSSSGTWRLGDIHAELLRRAGQKGDDDMPLSEDDVGRVARAVWALLLHDPALGDHPTAATLLQRVRRDTDPTGLDRAVWGRVLTDPILDDNPTAATLLQRVRRDTGS